MYQRGFIGLLSAQFLGAFNDNVLRFLLIYFFLERAGQLPFSSEAYIAFSGALFILPFLIFSSYAGQWVDRGSKRRTLMIAKAWEIPVMAVASWGLMEGNLVFLLISLFATGIQASFFGPAKYCILPHLVSSAHLAKANSLVGGTTFLGILLGAMTGGYLADLHHPLLSGLCLLLVAMVGLISLCFLQKDIPSPISEPFDPYPMGSMVRLLKEMKSYPLAFLSALLISYLWFLGALLQLLLPLYGTKILQLNGTLTQTLIMSAAIGIAIGCFAISGFSEERVRMKACKAGLLGMAFCGLWLGLDGADYVRALGCLFFLGFCGGLFIVPLYTLLQKTTPRHRLGRVISANNFLNTIALLLASLFLYGTGDRLKLAPDTIILLASIGTAITAFLFARREIAPARSALPDDVRGQIKE